MDRLSQFPAFDDFEAVTHQDVFAGLPDGWLVGVSDVAGSTKAIAAGRYKAVNIAGAAPISGLMNALDTRRFPFAFAGDGCAFVLPAEDRAVAQDVLRKTAAWVRDDLGLTLRVALVPVEAVRAAGFDVRGALFKPTQYVDYAMFDGGGIAWAEAEMKAGRFTLPPAPPGERPDLHGLSCRWLPIRAQHGRILSMIMRPLAGAEHKFGDAMGRLIGVLDAAGGCHPVPEEGPDPALVSPGTRLEALASRGTAPLWRKMLAVAAHNVMGWGFFKTRIKAGGFDPAVYRAMVSKNADCRKFGDGLLVTADCNAAAEAKVRAVLAEMADAGLVRFGIVQQEAAVMTCIVPAFDDHGHFHFIDGAGGGYTAAARAMDGKDAALVPELASGTALAFEPLGAALVRQVAARFGAAVRAVPGVARRAGPGVRAGGRAGASPRAYGAVRAGRTGHADAAL